MKYSLTIFALLLALRASAQLTVGSSAMNVLSGTSLAINGLTLTPSTSLIIANNTIQKSPLAITGSRGSISRVYLFSAPLLFSGTAGINYLPTELNGYGEASLQLAYAPAVNTALTVTTGSSSNTATHYVANTLTSQSIAVVTASALPDLVPIMNTLPAIQYGTTNFTVVVDVFELNSAPANGVVTVYISKDPLMALSFNPGSDLVGGKLVQNSSWSFDNTVDDFYVLTTTAGLVGKGKKSFGLTGVMSPGNTKGSLTISSTIASVSGGEVKMTNNSDADKIDYFKK